MEIRSLAAQSYFNLLETEYEDSKNLSNIASPFPKVESSSIEALDKMYSSATMTDEFKEYFFSKYESIFFQVTNPF